MSARPCWPNHCNSPARICCADTQRKFQEFMSALFSTAMALREVGPGVYAGELNKHWTIGPKVHGGAMLALCANAARTAHARGDDAGRAAGPGWGSPRLPGRAGQSSWQPVA